MKVFLYISFHLYLLFMSLFLFIHFLLYLSSFLSLSFFLYRLYLFFSVILSISLYPSLFFSLSIPFSLSLFSFAFSLPLFLFFIPFSILLFWLNLALLLLTYLCNLLHSDSTRNNFQNQKSDSVKVFPSRHLCILVPAPFWHLIFVNFLQCSGVDYALVFAIQDLIMVVLGTNLVSIKKRTISNARLLFFLNEIRCRFNPYFSWVIYLTYICCIFCISISKLGFFLSILNLFL